jgi:translin
MDMQKIIERMEKRDSAREETMKLTREVTRLSARAIRQIHRSLENLSEVEESKNSIKKARKLLEEVNETLKDLPEIYYAGFVENAQQEFVEASITFNIVRAFEDGNDVDIPSPEELNVTDPSYLKGLADAIGECRRYIISLLMKKETVKA